jgi:hypothetical protein
MAEFASRGVGSAGLTTGIIGTSLGALNSGILGNLFGNSGCACSENMTVNRYDLAQEQKIASLESQIALRDANIYTTNLVDSKILETYKDLSGRIDGINARLAEQAVFNATVNSTLGCVSGQVAQLMSLTKTIIPITNICPQPAVATTTA